MSVNQSVSCSDVILANELNMIFLRQFENQTLLLCGNSIWLPLLVNLQSKTQRWGQKKKKKKKSDLKNPKLTLQRQQFSGTPSNNSVVFNENCLKLPFLVNDINQKDINCFIHYFSSLKIFLFNFCIPENWTVYYKHPVQQNSKLIF